MLRIIRFFWGYVVFCVSGTSTEKFINYAARAGVGLFDVKKCKGVLYCSAIASEYRTLRKLARKSSVKIRITQKHGMPFFINRYKKRRGIFVGALCFGIVLYFLSLYIWSIDVEGACALDKGRLYDLIGNMGVGVGTLRSELDTPMLEKSIMNAFEEVAWVSANVRGSTLSFEIKERVAPPGRVPDAKPCNVKAAKAGQIVRMEIYEGTPEISNGDAVVKGQLLVSGIVEDDFGVSSLRHADAKIYAETRCEIKKEVDLCQMQKVRTGRTVTRKRLKFFGVELPLTLVTRPEGDYQKEMQINNLSVFGVSLPISYCKENWVQFCEQKCVLTNEMALEQALQELKSEESAQFGDAKILNMDKKQQIHGGKAIVTADYTCEEDVAWQEEISVEE